MQRIVEVAFIELLIMRGDLAHIETDYYYKIASINIR